MSFNLPYTALSLLHEHLAHLVSTNDEKFDFIDTNRIPYAIKFNKEIPNHFTVADENGYVKVFKSYPRLKIVKEFSVQSSCIYDLQWLNSHEIACGGGDKTVIVYDLNTGTKTAQLKGHTESVKSISLIPNNQFIIASGSRDGSVLIFDTRFNRHSTTEADLDECASIKPVNQIQIAHFIDSSNHSVSSPTFLTPNRSSSRATAHSNILKSKLNQNQSHHHHHHNHHIIKRPSPIACVSFQNEYLLVSAGATDGLIKVWDIRKIYSSNTAKKHIEPLPLYIFDNQLKKSSTSPTAKLISKGYSNLVFNSHRTKLYANCLNNQLYEYNFATYNQNHTRSLSSCHKQDENNKLKLSYHTNQSNFIKSSLSHCENFILTGSSDFNAYIYSTNLNSTCKEFKKHMPVIVLKGHTNEVTAVDWNPFDSNQLVTCSDDNTMRLWNVKRDIETIKLNECNFSQAEILNDHDDTLTKFTSTIRSYNRLYNKYLPNTTGIFDDVLFLNYEYKNFMRPRNESQLQDTEMQLVDDLEKELCIKCQNISIDNMEDDDSVSSKNLKSIENHLNNLKETNNNFIHLETPLSNLPINIIDPNEVCVESKPNTQMQKSQSPKLNSFSLLLGESKPKMKTIKKTVKTSPKPTKSTINQKDQCSTTSGTPIRMITKNPTSVTSTSKKRSWDASTDKPVNDLDETKTPKTKRRLIMGASQQADLTACASPSTPKTTNKTILHYFSPLFQPK